MRGVRPTHRRTARRIACGPPTASVTETEIRHLAREILAVAREYGLDPIPVVFEMVDADDMNQVASYGGFPTRYPHWRFGMEYEEMRKGYTWGLHKIYELVINNDPSYAYLLRSNGRIDQKMVIAHVYGHSDFFKCNLWFSQTNRRMIDEMANHGTRIRRYIERYGQDRVEEFVDAALSLENLIDYHSVYNPAAPRPRLSYAEPEDTPVVKKLPSKGYMDRYINPPEFLEEQRRKIEDALQKKKRFPESPQRDGLKFLIDFAPLEMWQRDVLAIVREEAYYFAPQALTKILNEGWAAYWHSKLLTERLLHDEELIEYAEHHSGVMGGSGGPLNPYKLGLELFKDVEERWNKGRFGREWDECDDADRKANWDTGLGKGREKIFEVRRIYNDITFIDSFLTPEFCERHKMFAYQFNPHTNRYEITSRRFEDVKRQLLTRLTNMGHPRIAIVDGNFGNRSELLLRHDHDGPDLEIAEARDTLRNMHKVWQRPVHVQTLLDGTKKMYTFDGEKHAESTGEK